MKRICHCLLLLLFITIPAVAQNVDVIIINDVGGTFPGPTGSTWAKWDSAASINGFSDTVVLQTYLDSTAFLNTSKALVITNASLSNIDASQLIAYVQSGRSVYIQTKDDTASLGNKAFSQAINNLGGTFVWGKRFNNNFGRTVTGSLQNLPHNVMFCTAGGVCNPVTTTDYNGAIAQTTSCEVVPFLFNTDVSLSPAPPTATAWMYTPLNSAHGRVMSATSTSWMTHGSGITYPAVIYPLLGNMLYHLINRHEGDSTRAKYSTIHKTICANEMPYSWNGQPVNQGGATAAVFHGNTIAGCDSIVTLNLTVNPVYNQTVSFNICPSALPYYWNGVMVQQSGDGVATFDTTSALGCDSFVRLNLHLLPIYKDTQTVTICSSQLPYTWNGNYVNNVGQYFFTYKTTSLAFGCDSIIHLDLNVLPTPAFTIDDITQGQQRSYCIGDTVELSLTGNPSRYEWYEEDDVVAIGNPVSLKLSDALHLFTIKGYNQLGCSVDKSITIAAENCCGISMPSAFSPNGDGLNDGFGAFTIGHPNFFSLSIYDRWGNQVFTSNSLNTKWDGTYKGKIAAAGTYFFNVQSECSNGTQYHHKGTLTLVR